MGFKDAAHEDNKLSAIFHRGLLLLPGPKEAADDRFRADPFDVELQVELTGF